MVENQEDSHVVSFAAVFWMSRNAPPKETSLGGALRDIQKTAAKETNSHGETYVFSCS